MSEQNEKELFEAIEADLLENHVAFLHSRERIKELRRKGLGLPFTPPSTVYDGSLVKEAITACLNPPVVTDSEIKTFRKLAQAWGAFRLAAYDIYGTALRGEADPIICKIIGTKNEKMKFTLYPGYPDPMPLLRLDTMWNGQTWKTLDTNSSRPAGVGWSAQLSITLAKHLGLGRAFPFFETAAAVILEAYTAWCDYFSRPRKDEPTIAIVIEYNQGTSPSYYALANLFVRNGYNAKVVYDYELEYRDGQIFTVSGKQIDIIVRGCKPDLGKGGKVIADTYPNACCVVPPLYRRCLGHKAWMFIMQSEKLKGLFEARLGDHFEVLQKSLPKTLLVRQGVVIMPDFQTHLDIDEIDRNRWVLKASTGSSSRGIFVGKTFTRTKWREVTASVKNDPGIWLLQEFIEPPRIAIRIPGQNGEIEDLQGFKTETAVYIHGGEFAGLHLMASQTSYKIHGGIGTVLVPYFLRD